MMCSFIWHRLTTFGMVVFLAWGTFGSTSAQEWARKMFKEQVHNFGNVAGGSTAVHRFEFQNIYKEDVHIHSVTSSCGCTAASIENDKRLLKTYEKSAIVAKFNTKTFRNQNKATLIVRIDRPYPAEVQLIVTGNIRANTTFEPGVIEFGEVPEQTKIRQVVRISNRGNNNWRIVDVKSTFNRSQIKVALNEVFRGNGNVGYDMTVELQDNVPHGYVQGELFIVTNEAPNSRYPITFNANVTAALQLSPEVLTLGPLQPGEEVGHKVVLKANRPFRITGVTTSDECLTVDPGGDKPNRLQFLNVKYVAREQAGQHECQARIATDLGNEFSAVFKTIATVEENDQR